MLARYLIEVAALLVHSDPDAALASQNWFIAHTSSPQVHASLLIADPSVLEQAPPGTKNWKKHRDERNDRHSPQPPFTRKQGHQTFRIATFISEENYFWRVIFQIMPEHI